MRKLIIVALLLLQLTNAGCIGLIALVVADQRAYKRREAKKAQEAAVAEQEQEPQVEQEEEVQE